MRAHWEEQLIDGWPRHWFRTMHPGAIKILCSRRLETILWIAHIPPPCKKPINRFLLIHVVQHVSSVSSPSLSAATISPQYWGNKQFRRSWICINIALEKYWTCCGRRALQVFSLGRAKSRSCVYVVSKFGRRKVKIYWQLELIQWILGLYCFVERLLCKTYV